MYPIILSNTEFKIQQILDTSGPNVRIMYREICDCLTVGKTIIALHDHRHHPDIHMATPPPELQRILAIKGWGWSWEKASTEDGYILELFPKD